MFRVQHLERRWKPIFVALKNLLFFILLFTYGRTQAEENHEDPDDKIGIIVERSPYTIKFHLRHPDLYEIQNVSCKRVRNVEIAEAKYHMCDNLEPCSLYQATLTIKNLHKDNLQTIEKTLEVDTEYKELVDQSEPEVNNLEIETFFNAINVTWLATDKSCISSFLIEAKSVDKDFKWTVANDKSYLLMDGLNPCQEHMIQLKTYDSKGKFISNRTATNSTLYIDPGRVNLTIVDYDNAHKNVSWQPLQYPTCVRYFYIRWFIVGCADNATKPYSLEISYQNNQDHESELQCEWFANLTDSNSREFIIGNLQGCEKYQVQIYINNNITVNAEKTFVSPEQVPGPVKIKSTNISSTSIIMHWIPPVFNSKCVKHYLVYLVGPLQRPQALQQNLIVTTDDTFIFFKELHPCGRYNLTIVPQSLNGVKGTIKNSSFEILEAAPTVVRNYVVSITPFTLNISWDPPAFADLCIVSYRLSGWNDENRPVATFDKIITDTNVTIEELNSCQPYTIQIIPTTKNMNGELLHFEAETAAVAAQAPSFETTGIYPSKFELSAQDSDLNNRCTTIFARFVCEVGKDVNVPYKFAEQYVEGLMGGIIFNTQLGPLSPYTDYKCSVALYNIAGWSPYKTMVKRTEPYYPDPPEKVDLKIHTNYSLSFNWNAPQYSNGNVKLYISYFQLVGAAYFIPPKCNQIVTDPIIRETSSLEQSFIDLQPYTRYSLQVAAQNEFGVGEYTRPNMAKTKPWVSDPVTNVRAVPEGPFETDLEYKANVRLTWFVPCRSNGEIEYFLLKFTGDRKNLNRIEFSRKIEANFNEDGSLIYNEANLSPEYNYTVTVSVKTRGVNVVSPSVREQFEAPAGIPKLLNSTAIEKARVEAYENNNPSKSVIIKLPVDFLDSDFGTIIYMAFLLSEKNCNSDPDLKFGAMNTNTDWPESRSWKEVYTDDSTNCISQYQTTPLRWKPTVNKRIGSKIYKIRNMRSNEYIEYVVGKESCHESSTRYCNGPLKPGTEYNLVIRLFTKSGYNDVAVLQFRTDTLIQLTVILISISSCLLMAFIAGFIYLWITKRLKWHRESCHGIEDSFGDIILKKFAIYYREISRPEKIAREFKELTMVAMDLSCSASELGSNKNRYADIFPYDKNRVILDIDADGSDYINASFIDGYRKKKEYIATQGPKLESTMDFWRMILQHNVRVIVMVTQFREGDTIKCHEYFPFKSKGIEVTVKKRDSLELYDRTEMSVTQEMYGLKQKVVHLHFKKWPDHCCPSNPTDLITFVRKVKDEKVPNYSPIVVHCTAGVGRTGTFIALDIIMQRIKNESKINIYETVKKLRFQRMKMVQTLAQYTFLYTCAYELVKHKDNKKVSLEDTQKNMNNCALTEPGFREISTIGSNNSNGIAYYSMPVTFNRVYKADPEAFNEVTANNNENLLNS